MEKSVDDGTKSFEDAAFEMLSTVSPVKLPREDIPFDSVRQIVLNEILKSKQKTAKPSINGRKNMEEMPMEEGPSSSSSSSHVGESNSSNLDRGTMTDEAETGTPRPISARLYGDCTRSSSTSTSSALQCASSSDADSKKKPLNYREKRLAEIRAARMKKYRENAEIVEFKCEESGLFDAFSKFYGDLLDDDSAPANVYFRCVESLDVYFRVKTWESNCPKLLCEFLIDHILKTCQELNELHDSKSSSDEWRARECQIQVLLTLHVFVVTDDKQWLNEAINKLRMIYISVGAEKLRNFVEEPVTDIYCELIGDGLATIYDELCIQLPADLQQYDQGLFKMTETEDNLVTKRRNGAANRLEAMLMETSSELGVGGVEKSTKSTSSEVTVLPTTRRSLKRKNEDVPKALLSPARSTRSQRADYKQFFVEDTPDEKYEKRTTKKGELMIEKVEEEEEEEEAEEHPRKKKITIKEEIDEEVKQTPVAKLRAAAAMKNGKRCSKRLSDLVKLSEERAQIPKRARENLEKMLQKAQEVTPLRAVIRPTRKSVLFGTTPKSSPAMNGKGASSSSRTSLLSKFSSLSGSPNEELSIDTSGGHDLPGPSSSASESTTPVLRERSSRRRPVRYTDSFSEKNKPTLRMPKQEVEDAEFDEIEASSPGKRSTRSAQSSATKWTDRQLKRQLGLTREDLNRYRTAMLATGEGSRNGKNVKINWESAQVNRAGRVKGAGASEDGTPIFGIVRKNVRTMICHVLLNDTNPDTSFDWNKVKFDGIGNKPRTRQFQSLIEKPEAYMESLKRKYMESKMSPTKRARNSTDSMAQGPSAKRRRSEGSSPMKKSSEMASTSSPKFDEFGFEFEAEE